MSAAKTAHQPTEHSAHTTAIALGNSSVSTDSNDDPSLLSPSSSLPLISPISNNELNVDKMKNDTNSATSNNHSADLDLSTTNVFAFGLDRYSGFVNDENGRETSQNNQNANNNNSINNTSNANNMPSASVSDNTHNNVNNSTNVVGVDDQLKVSHGPLWEDNSHSKSALEQLSNEGYNDFPINSHAAQTNEEFAQFHHLEHFGMNEHNNVNNFHLPQLNGHSEHQHNQQATPAATPSGAAEFNPYLYLAGLNPQATAALAAYMNPLLAPNFLAPQQLAALAAVGLAAPGARGHMPHHAMNPSFCKFYAAGHCARGDQCNYAHVNMKGLPPGPPGAPMYMNGGYVPGQQPRHLNGRPSLNGRPDRFNRNGRPGTGNPRYNGQGRFTNGYKGPFNRYNRSGFEYGVDPNQANMMNLADTNGLFTAAHAAAANSDPNLLMGNPLVDQMGNLTMNGQYPTANGTENGAESAHTNTNSAYAADGNNNQLSNEFLSKFTINSSVDELKGNIYLIAKDQYGCRLLQKLIDEDKEGIVEATFHEVFDHMNELMTDPFGNYLCQKLVEHCTEPQRAQIIQKVAPDLVAISLNMHGTRAVQKLIETINTPTEVELVSSSLKSSVVTLIKDLNGNHVIQRCLHHLSSKDNQFIYDAVSRHCVSVATHKHGCCVLQRCIDYATINQKRQLVQEIVNNALELSQCSFANYVIQYVLDLGEPPISHQVMTNLLNHIATLSVQKFSSNVVEKCLELANDKMRMKIIDELFTPERLPRLLNDSYGNYVIQKALSVCKKAQFERLVNVIKPYLSSMKNTAFSKRIMNKIMKKFPDLQITFDIEDDNGVVKNGSNGVTPTNSRHSMQTMIMPTNGTNGGPGPIPHPFNASHPPLSPNSFQQQLNAINAAALNAINMHALGGNLNVNALTDLNDLLNPMNVNGAPHSIQQLLNGGTMNPSLMAHFNPLNGAAPGLGDIPNLGAHHPNDQFAPGLHPNGNMMNGAHAHAHGIDNGSTSAESSAASAPANGPSFHPFNGNGAPLRPLENGTTPSIGLDLNIENSLPSPSLPMSQMTRPATTVAGVSN